MPGRERANGAQRTGELLAHQCGGRSANLLDATELASQTCRAVAEVEIVNGDLLVEASIWRRRARKRAEHHPVEVPHEVAAHHMPTRVLSLQLRGEQEVG